jgi:hypothetical protein
LGLAIEARTIKSNAPADYFTRKFIISRISPKRHWPRVQKLGVGFGESGIDSG